MRKWKGFYLAFFYSFTIKSYNLLCQKLHSISRSKNSTLYPEATFCTPLLFKIFLVPCLVFAAYCNYLFLSLLASSWNKSSVENLTHISQYKYQHDSGWMCHRNFGKFFFVLLPLFRPSFKKNGGYHLLLIFPLTLLVSNTYAEWAFSITI